MQAGQQDACFDGVEGTNTTDCNDGQGSFKGINEFLSQILIKYSDWDKLTESTCKANFVILKETEISLVLTKPWPSGEVALWFILRSLTVLSKKGRVKAIKGLEIFLSWSDYKFRYANGRFYEAEICTATCNENLCRPNLISFAAWNSARTSLSDGSTSETNSGSLSNLIGSLTNSSSYMTMSLVLAFAGNWEVGTFAGR